MKTSSSPPCILEAVSYIWRLMLASSALAGGLLAVYTFDPDMLYASGLYTFIQASIFELSNVFAIRMAGMHVIVIGTIWMRTAVIPRWLAFVTSILALVLLISITFLPWVTLIFPSCVIVISVYILVLNYCYQQEMST